MAKVKIQGHASGSGVLTVTAPNTSSDRTITLPDATGTLLNSDGSAASLTAIPAANITGTLPAISGANLTGFTYANMPVGSIIQVVTLTRAKTSTFDTTSTSAVILNDGVGDWELAITPKYTGSTIIGYCSIPGVSAFPTSGSVQIEVFKAGSTLRVIDSHLQYHSEGTHGGMQQLSFHFIEDSVGTTSAVTYDVRVQVNTGSITGRFFDNHVSSSPISTF